MTNGEKILSILEAQGNLLGELKQDVGAIKQDVTEIKLDIENRIDPQLRALAEGQKTILESVVPKSRVDQLEEEVDLLKTVIRSLSSDVEELKKAQ